MHWTQHTYNPNRNDWNPPKECVPKIVCAAVWFAGTDFLVPMVRHYHPSSIEVVDLVRKEVGDDVEEVQGFLDQWGRFYDREQAFKLCTQTGQISSYTTRGRDTLFSEYLY